MCKGLYENKYANGGFYVMNQYGNEANKTNQHNEKNRDLIWKHTNQILDATL
jgi:hypothetical protein